ncbi:hypothetical protein RUND412_010335 [Rhizina undulata]
MSPHSGTPHTRGIPESPREVPKESLPRSPKVVSKASVLHSSLASTALASIRVAKVHLYNKCCLVLTNNSIPATSLLAFKSVLKKALAYLAISGIHKNAYWVKYMVHNVPITLLASPALSLLTINEEIETYNPSVTLA